jgi:crotonobetaine/carnitine-CoA ligase
MTVTPFARLLDAHLEKGATLRCDGVELSPADIVGHACAVAAQLRDLGVTTGSRVATVTANSPHAVAAWFASAIVGCLEVPISTQYRGDLLTYLLRDSAVSVVVCDAAFQEQVADALGGTSVIDILVIGDQPAEPDGVRVHALAAPGGHDVTELYRPVGGPAAGVVLYTSGTTGWSKGVLHSQESTLELARAVAGVNGYTRDDVLLNFFPLYHQNARYTGVTTALVAGCGMQLDSAFSSSRFWDVCRAGGVTAFNYLGSVLGMILKASEPLTDGQAHDHAVRVAWGAGAHADEWGAFKRRFGVTLTEVYGLSEAPMATVNSSADPAPAGSAGRESDLFQIRVMGDDGALLPPGEPGEIVLRPKRPNIFMKGYLRRDADTVAATRDLWFHSGDSGWLSEEGYLYFADRITDSIRRRGENISAVEIESVLLGHPGVRDCAVYAVRPDGAFDDEVMLALVVAPGTDPAAVVADVAHRLPRYALPRFVRVLPDLPRTPTQKVRKADLRRAGITADAIDLSAPPPTPQARA